MNNEALSIKELERLCDRVAKKIKKPDRTDEEAYAAYLNGLEYHTLLREDLLKKECEKLEKTAKAKGREEQEKYADEIQLLEKAIRLLKEGKLQAEPKAMEHLYKSAQTDFRIIAQNHKELSPLKQVLELDMKYFYFFSPATFLDTTGNEDSQQLYTKEFLNSLKKIFQEDEDAYFEAMIHCAENIKTYDDLYQNMEQYEKEETEKHRNNLKNNAELAHQIKTELLVPIQNASKDRTYQEALYYALMYPECVMRLYKLSNLDETSPVKCDAETSENLIDTLIQDSESHRYRISQKIITRIALSLNILFAEKKPEESQNNQIQKEQSMENLGLVLDYIRVDMPKYLKEAKEYFGWIENKVKNPNNGELIENMNTLDRNHDKFLNVYKRWQENRRLMRDVEPPRDSEMGRAIAQSDDQMEWMCEYVKKNAPVLLNEYNKCLGDKPQVLAHYQELASQKYKEVDALREELKKHHIEKKAIKLKKEMKQLAHEMEAQADTWGRESALNKGFKKELQKMAAKITIFADGMPSALKVEYTNVIKSQRGSNVIKGTIVGIIPAILLFCCLEIARGRGENLLFNLVSDFLLDFFNSLLLGLIFSGFFGAIYAMAVELRNKLGGFETFSKIVTVILIIASIPLAIIEIRESSYSLWLAIWTPGIAYLIGALLNNIQRLLFVKAEDKW